MLNKEDLFLMALEELEKLVMKMKQKNIIQIKAYL